VNDDSFEDSIVNDGCAALGAPESNCSNALDDDGDGRVNDGCAWTGTYPEALFSILTGDQDACGYTGWPADLVSSGTSFNKVDLVDIGSFYAPTNHYNTTPGQPGFFQRWDLIPGPMITGGVWINSQDIGALLAGPTSTPPMLGGAPVFNGPSCPWPP